MRLFHVSEDGNIERFVPRPPTRTDLDPNIGLVWALCERTLPNFLTPRDAPRVCFHAHERTPPSLVERLFSFPDRPYVVAVEAAWLERLRRVKLYLYEVSPEGFALQDENAGYYVSTKTQTPLARWEVDDCLQALAQRRVELRVLPGLWPLCHQIQALGGALHWSMCRMQNALPPP